MNHKIASKLALALMASASIAFANVPSELITLDDLGYPTLAPISDGYAGLDWNNMYVISGSYYSSYFPGSSLQNAIVSPPNAGFNGYGAPAGFSSGSTFDLDSAYLTAAYLPDVVDVQGWDGATLEYNNLYTISPTAPTFINFDNDGITSVDFSDTVLGYPIAWDNISINGGAVPQGGATVPDCGTTSMMLGGALMGLGLLRKKLC